MRFGWLSMSRPKPIATEGNKLDGRGYKSTQGRMLKPNISNTTYPYENVTREFPLVKPKVVEKHYSTSENSSLSKRKFPQEVFNYSVGFSLAIFHVLSQGRFWTKFSCGRGNNLACITEYIFYNFSFPCPKL